MVRHRPGCSQKALTFQENIFSGKNPFPVSLYYHYNQDFGIGRPKKVVNSFKRILLSNHNVDLIFARILERFGSYKEMR